HDDSYAFSREYAASLHGGTTDGVAHHGEFRTGLGPALCASRGTDGDVFAGCLLGQYRRVIPVEPTPAGQDRRGAFCNGLTGSGQKDSCSSQRHAAMRRLSSWIDRMSIFFKSCQKCVSVYDVSQTSTGPETSCTVGWEHHVSWTCIRPTRHTGQALERGCGVD